MRIVTYNIAFGFNARSLLKSLLGHFCMHALRSPALVRLQSRFARQAVDLACSSSPDILCLNEVLPHFHGNELRQRLENAGFQMIINVVGPAADKNLLSVNTVLATREAGKILNLHLPFPAVSAPGKRTAAVYMPRQNMTVLATHLSILKSLRQKQILIIKKFIDEQLALKRKLIVLGDLNHSLKKLTVLGLQGKSVTTNLYPWYLRKPFGFAPDLDHILFSKNFSLINIKTASGYSDHLLLSCDLQG